MSAFFKNDSQSQAVATISDSISYEYNIEASLNEPTRPTYLTQQEGFRNPGLYGCNRWKSSTRPRANNFQAI